MKLLCRPCTLLDVETVRDFAERTFVHTFAHLNTKEDMDAYVHKAFSIDKVRTELSNADSSFYFVYADDVLAGYLKLNEELAQTDVFDEHSLEIERIYVSIDFQGKGIGTYLMNEAIRIANERGKEYVWLGVWEKNEHALQFYEKHGFVKIGTHKFVFGNEEQLDYIMKKDL